ncbi:MAG: 50S ribosome-binding GTPase [Chloroflexi bacterium]|nr:50S ribosome-binding GTPase [Chloroflexota bacterium]
MAELLRLVTAGSVDTGKSTLIGRLLFDSRHVYDDQLAAIEAASQRRARGHLDLSMLTDGLRAEREQGITIDVAYRYFTTPARKFVLADTPGHVQYTRNMVTGASLAHVCVLVVDVVDGLTEQTRRHAVIAGLLGVETLILAINKMDRVGYSQDAFDTLTNEFTAFADGLGFDRLAFVPISALHGENVVRSSSEMPWYGGPSLLTFLETVPFGPDHDHEPLRLPIQLVIRAGGSQPGRQYTGRIASGTAHVGDQVAALPSGIVTTIRSLAIGNEPTAESSAGASVSLTISDDLDVSRGSMLVDPARRPVTSRSFTANVTALGSRSIEVGAEFSLKHTSRWSRCFIRSIDFVYDLSDLSRHDPAESIHLNDVAQVRIETLDPLFLDPYAVNRTTGSMIIVDRATNETVMAGMVVEAEGLAAS